MVLIYPFFKVSFSQEINTWQDTNYLYEEVVAFPLCAATAYLLKNPLSFFSFTALLQ
jgi:hypothetical protein